MTAPVPVVTVNDAEVARAGDGSSPLLVDALTVTWGREGLLDHPELSTAALALFDPTRTWHTRGDLIGQRVTVQATYSGTTYTPFEGRITAVTVRPHTAAGIDGALVELTCVSLLADLANKVPRGAWPQETVTQRAARIAAAAPNHLTGGVSVPTAYASAVVGPVLGKEQRSVLDHLRALYDSLGAGRMSWDPGTRTATWIPRRRHAWRGLASLYKEPGVPARVRPFMVPTDLAWGPRAGAGSGAMLDASRVTDAEGLTRSIEGRIATVQVTQPLTSSGVQTDTFTNEYAVPGADTATEGERTASIDSVMLSTDPSSTAAAGEITGLLAAEGRAWRTGPVTATRLTGDDLDEAAWVLLTGQEVPGLLALQGSWLPRLGVCPVVAVTGGAIVYAGGEWSAEFLPAPVSVTGQYHPLAWNDGQLDTGPGGTASPLVWGAGSLSLDRSVTWADMRWVAAGHAREPADIPANKGWDFY
jgi:hypothetical protein